MRGRGRKARGGAAASVVLVRSRRRIRGDDREHAARSGARRLHLRGSRAAGWRTAVEQRRRHRQPARGRVVICSSSSPSSRRRAAANGPSVVVFTRDRRHARFTRTAIERRGAGRLQPVRADDDRLDLGAAVGIRDRRRHDAHGHVADRDVVPRGEIPRPPRGLDAVGARGGGRLRSLASRLAASIHQRRRRQHQRYRLRRREIGCVASITL